MRQRAVLLFLGVAVIILASVGGGVLGVESALAASGAPGFHWVLQHTSGWSTPSYREGAVDATCDGPHRVYVARSADGDSMSVALFVLANGCSDYPRPPAEAPVQ